MKSVKAPRGQKERGHAMEPHRKTDPTAAIRVLLGPFGVVAAGVDAAARLNVSKAREGFPELVSRAAYGKERTIVSRRGKDLAAIVPIEDLRLLERLVQEELDRIDLEDARAALREAEEMGTIPLEEARKRLGL